MKGHSPDPKRHRRKEAVQKRAPIYKVAMEEASCRAVCPGTFLPVLMIEGKSGSHFGLSLNFGDC
jgi:hypothetical protein